MRAESERTNIKGLLATRDRSDVAEDDSLLTVAERQVIQTWEEKMLKLSVLETRVDEALFVLRDLPLLD
jgi:DNA-directed RNA polymerase III subunit RPC3